MKVSFFNIGLLVVLFAVGSCVPINQASSKFITTAYQEQQIDADKVDPCTEVLSYRTSAEHPEFTPIKYVRVNFHVMREDDGSGNFSEEEGRAYIKSMLGTSNGRFSKNARMHLPIGNSTNVSPTRIQLKLTGQPDVPGDDGIYFHNDSELCYINNLDRRENIFSRDQYEKYGIQKGEVINIFMMEHHPDSLKSKSYKKGADGVGPGRWTKIVGYYKHSQDSMFYNGKKIKNPPWARAGIYCHEIGHCLGLNHTWNQNDGCDDTPRNRNCWHRTKEGPCSTGWSNNMMDYNNNQNSITPCQIARMQFNLTHTGKFQRNMVEKTWCTYKPFSPIKIAKDSTFTWQCDKDLESDLIIERGASLTMLCQISMAPGSKIVVKPGGTLILDGTRLYNDCDEEWKGIQIMKTGIEEGVVIMKNSAKLENVRTTIPETKKTGS